MRATTTARAVAGLGALVALAASHLAGAHTTTVSDTIQVGVPGVIGIVEITAACDPDSPDNGLDGIWLDVAGFDDHAAVLGVEPGTDFDVRFYDEDCAFIEDFDMAAQGIGQPESGTVPDGAAFALVQLFLGHDASFTLVLY